ncbi:hypothetical protein ACHAQA_008502 [Verticillium albo-atrum]
MTVTTLFDHFDNPTEDTEHYHAMNYCGVWRRLLKGSEDKNFKTLPYEDRLITDTRTFRKNYHSTRNSVSRVMEQKSSAASRLKRHASAATVPQTDLTRKLLAGPTITTGFDWADDMEEAVQMRENNIDGWEDRFARGMEVDSTKEGTTLEPVPDQKKSWGSRWSMIKSNEVIEEDDEHETTDLVQISAGNDFDTNSSTPDDASYHNFDRKDDNDSAGIEEQNVYDQHKDEDEEETESDEDDTSDEDTTEVLNSEEACSSSTTIETHNCGTFKGIDCSGVPLDADGQLTLHYDGASARSPFNPAQPAEQGSITELAGKRHRVPSLSRSVTDTPQANNRLNAPKFVQALLEAARSELESTPEFKRRFRYPLAEKRWVRLAQINHTDKRENAQEKAQTARRIKGMTPNRVMPGTPLSQVMLMEDWMAEDQAGSGAA